MSDGSIRPISFPFTAIYGLDEAKEAILCAVINPNVRSVLLRGSSGEAKTTLARSISDITEDRRLINAPLNITEDRLFGTIDIESALNKGVVELQRGLLSDADDNFLYLDDVNLFDKRLLNSILNVLESGTVLIERDGLSTSYKCKTTIIASMNTNGPPMDPSFLDRFDICINMDHTLDDEGRLEILKRSILFNEDPVKFRNSYQREEAELKDRISSAKDILPSIGIPMKLMYAIANDSKSLGIESHRGDLAVAHVSVALAALDGRGDIDYNDVKNASRMCLYHRRKVEAISNRKKSISFIDHRIDENDMIVRSPEIIPGADQDYSMDELNDIPELDGFDVPIIGEIVAEVSDVFESIDIMEFDRMQDIGSKRATTISRDRSGRYVNSRISDGSNPDLAFDATIRSAAPYQIKRRGDTGKEGFIIEKQDLREKIRKKRRRCTFLFIVDNSGSLIIRNRISLVKASILSMLESHYVKRDRVGFMTFSEDSIDIVMNPSRSIEMIFDILDSLKTGSGTPLAQAILTTADYMKTYMRKHPDEICYVIMITDGKANIPIEEGVDIIGELLEVARNVDVPDLRWIVIDSGIGYTKSDIPLELANILGGIYFTLDELNADPNKLKNV